MKRLIAYYRVSTPRQGASGLGLDAQRAAVHAYVALCGATLLAEYTEVESGRRNDREQLRQCVLHASGMQAVVVVAKLDRLSRDARFLLELVDYGVGIHFLDLPEFSGGDSVVGRLTLTIVAAIAEFEARRIRQRCLEAAEQNRKRGVLMGWQAVGRNPLTDEHRAAGSEAARSRNQKKAEHYAAGVLPVLQRMRSEGMTLRQISDSLDALGHKTRRGRRWTPANVSRLLNKRASS